LKAGNGKKRHQKKLSVPEEQPWHKIYGPLEPVKKLKVVYTHSRKKEKKEDTIADARA
jgi:hypothetical protein